MLEDVFILEAEGVKIGPPTTLAGCKKTGPCPHVSCRHHNYLEVDGDIVKINFPHLGPEELKNPCSLRVAGRAGKRKPTGPNGEVMSHAEVSKELNLSCERTRQLETVALRKVKREARPPMTLLGAADARRETGAVKFWSILAFGIGLMVTAFLLPGCATWHEDWEAKCGPGNDPLTMPCSCMNPATLSCPPVPSDAKKPDGGPTR